MKKYTNPVPFTDGKRHTNPDPYILRFCGRYYCYATDEVGVKVSVSDNLTEWRHLGLALQEAEHKNYWAPAVLYENGIFYMYYSNVNINELEAEDGHRIYLKLATANRPEGPFAYQKTFFEKFSIDAHPHWWNGKLHLFYSVNDWVGTDEMKAGTCILQDELVDLEKLAGNPVPVVVPELPQEIFQKNRFGDGRDWYTIEGACTLVHGAYTWLMYSANAYTNVDYYVGYCLAENKEKFSEMEFNRIPDENSFNPLVIRNELYEGTGHNTVTKAPNLVDDWIVYHSRLADEPLIPEVEQREMHINRLYYNGKDLMCPGLHHRTNIAPQQPGQQLRDMELEKTVFFSDRISYYYQTEFWISGRKHHTGIRYGIYLDYYNEDNYLELQFHSGQRLLTVVGCKEGLKQELIVKSLNQSFDYTVPHCCRIRRRGVNYQIQLDDYYLFDCEFQSLFPPNKIGLVPYFSAIMLHSFIYTETVELIGKDLAELHEFYEISKGHLNKKGIAGDQWQLNELYRGGNYQEEFLFKPLSHHNAFRFVSGEQLLVEVENVKELYTITHWYEGTLHHFIANGEQIDFTESVSGNILLTLWNTQLMEYRYTKI